MDIIQSTDLTGIFNNIPKNSKKSKSKELPTFGDFLDPCTGSLNRSNPLSLHKNLLETLSENKKEKTPTYTGRRNSFNDNVSQPTQPIQPTRQVNTKTNYMLNKTKPTRSIIPNTMRGRLNDHNVNNANNANNVNNDHNDLVVIHNTNELYNTRLQLYNTPNGEINQVLYCLVSAIIPEFSSYGNELRQTSFKKIRDRLAYDLDEKDLYKQFDYKRVFKKYDVQSLLLSNKPINNGWLFRYLSDFFNINIGIINHSLIFLVNSFTNRPTILLHRRNRNIGLITNNGSSMLSASLAKLVVSQAKYTMEEFSSQSKYKLDDLQLIATSLTINIKTEITPGKYKNRKKDDLYSDIKNVLAYW